VTKEDALRAIYKGESTFYVLNFLSLFTYLFYLWMADTNSLLGEMAADPASYAWVVVGLLIAYGIGRKSRVMALLALSICMVSLAILLVTFPAGPDPVGILLIALFFYFLIQAVRGSFAYHRLMKAEDPTYRATKIWHVLIGAPLTVLILFILVAAFALQTGIISEEDLELELPPPSTSTDNQAAS
jgi:hypothetical protein